MMDVFLLGMILVLGCVTKRVFLWNKFWKTYRVNIMVLLAMDSGSSMLYMFHLDTGKT
jgi:hypothetical protein